MEEKVLLDVLQHSRQINKQLTSFLGSSSGDRDALLSELASPLRHVSQSLLVLISVGRSRSVTDAVRKPPDTECVDAPPHFEIVAEHLHQLIARVTRAPSAQGSQEATSPGTPGNGAAGVLPDQGTRASWATAVYGCEEAVLALQQALVLPRRFPQLFSGRRVAWRRILLYGPPGTGKTHLVRVAAEAVNAVLIDVSGADLLSKWVGESEKQLRQLFQIAAQYEQCIVFLDELDALCGARGSSSETEASRRLKTEFLLQLQALPPNVTLLAATNLPWEIDAAVRRRFDRFVYVGMPSAAARRRMVQDRLAGIPCDLSNAQLDQLVQSTALHSTSDLLHVVDHAVQAPLQLLLAHTALRLATAQERTTPRTTDCVSPALPSPSSPQHHDADDMNEDSHPLSSTSHEGELLFVPCSADDPRAVPHLTADALAPHQLILPPVTYTHFEAALAAYPPSTQETELRRIRDWVQHTSAV